jgi:iron complex outermembrane receptor protein
MLFPPPARSRVGELILMALLSASGALPAFAIEVHPFDIPEEEAAAAIRDFGEQAHVQILVAGEAVKGKKLHAVTGEFSTEDGLNTLLSGSGLTHRYVGDHSIALLAAQASGSASSTQVQLAGTGSADPGTQEGKNDSSAGFLLVQVDQGQTSSPSTGEAQQGQAAEMKPQLEEVVVTGSRIPRTQVQGAQEVHIYTAEQIEQSGQTTVADFLSTLPAVSLAVAENGYQATYGSTTVQLRGLPFGTTLVLLNGRRLQTSGTQAQDDFFDLNNIPLSAVERIEVVADGSSAIYGSDAIAGVVNILLKTNFTGLEVNAKYGAASGIHEWDESLAWGQRWDKGSLSIVASDQERTDLDFSQRMLTASQDYRAFGGPDNNFPDCNPPNVFSANGSPLPGLGTATYAAVPTGYTGKPSIAEFRGTAGTLNECPFTAGDSLIPATHRAGVFIHGDYELTQSVDVFTELLYSHVQQFQYMGYPNWFGQPGLQNFTVSPQNPYNPFGTTVGVSDVITNIGRIGQFLITDFFRPLVGARGELFHDWKWEVSAWTSTDRSQDPNPNLNANNAAIQNALNSPNPATALNPFVAGPPGPQSLLQSFYTQGLATYTGRGDEVTGYITGPVFQLPSGPLGIVIGSEYERDTLASHNVNLFYEAANSGSTSDRRSSAVFGEARIPIIGNRAERGAGETLVLTVAGRRDNYSDFGTANTPQYGLEWRPTKALLVRTTYAKSFKAPSLYNLYSPIQSFPNGALILDPVSGRYDSVTLVSGGNPGLQPETGLSKTAGFVYLSQLVPGLELSATYWEIVESNTIDNISPELIVANEDSFPGRVIRGPGSNGQPGPITTVITTPVNFGAFSVTGIDYQAKYKYDSGIGLWTPSVNVSQTYRYLANLLPGVAATERVSQASDDGAWAPRWKGTAAIAWKLGAITATFDGRYVSKYQDYDSTREIGNFWLCDLSIRYELGSALASRASWLNGSYVSAGGVNIFDRPPQYSSYASNFLGYDPTQADIRGRFLFAQIGAKW